MTILKKRDLKIKRKKKTEGIGNNEDTDQNRGKIAQMSRVSTVYELVGWVGEETGMGAVQWGVSALDKKYPNSIIDLREVKWTLTVKHEQQS